MKPTPVASRTRLPEAMQTAPHVVDGYRRQHGQRRQDEQEAPHAVVRRGLRRDEEGDREQRGGGNGEKLQTSGGGYCKATTLAHQLADGNEAGSQQAEQHGFRQSHGEEHRQIAAGNLSDAGTILPSKGMPRRVMGM